MRPSRLLVLLALLLPPCAKAQAVRDRVVAAGDASDRALVAWDSVLASATEVAMLPSIAQAPLGDKHLRTVAHALLSLRRGQLLQRRADLAEALRQSTLATKLRRTSAWGNVVSARSLAALSFQGGPPGTVEGQFDGESYHDAIWRHFREAFERQATFTPAVRAIVTLLVASGDRELHDVQRALLADILRAQPDNPEALLVHGRDLRSRGAYDSALAAFDRALVHGDSSLLDLERARALRALADTAAAEVAYWRGASRLTPRGRMAYRYDLEWILEDDELARFDATPDDSVSAWLARLWASRDADAAAARGSRVSEHLRRWVVVHREYRAFKPWQRTMFAGLEVGYEPILTCVGNSTELRKQLSGLQPRYPGDLRNRETLLDHRGLIYLRHGEPLQRIWGPSGPEDADGRVTDRTEDDTWLYWIDGEWRVLHFSGSQALGHHAPTTLRSYLPTAKVGDYFSIGRFIPGYLAAAVRFQLLSVLPSVLPWECRSGVQALIAQTQRGALLAAETESNNPRIRRPWNAVVQAFSLGHASSNDGRALVTFAIPRRALTTTAHDSAHSSAAVHFRLVAYDAERGARVDLDSTRRFLLPRTSGQADHLSGWFELPLPAGQWQVAVRMDQGVDSVGAYALVRGLHIAAGEPLAMSDVITGLKGSRPLWPGDGEGFPLGVLGAWPAGSTLELYYEVLGMAAGEEYTMELEVRATATGSRDAVTSRASQRATGPITRVRQSLDLARLGPGRYRITVRIGRGGETVVRERPLLIVRG